MFLHTGTSQWTFFSLLEDQNKVSLYHQFHMKEEGPAGCYLFFFYTCAWHTRLLPVQKPAALPCSLPAVCQLSASTTSISRQQWAVSAALWLSQCNAPQSLLTFFCGIFFHGFPQDEITSKMLLQVWRLCEFLARVVFFLFFSKRQGQAFCWFQKDIKG